MSPRLAAVSLGLTALAQLAPFAPSAAAQCTGFWVQTPAVSGSASIDGAATGMLLWDPDRDGPTQPWLVMIGSFNNAGADASPRIVAWDGSTWFPIGGLVGSPEALVVHGGDLYVAGNIAPTGGPVANRVMRLNGTVWNPLPGVASSTIRCMISYNNQLIVGGSFKTIGGVNADSIALWNDTAWAALPGGGVNPGALAGTVVSLQPFQSRLIVGGTFTSVGPAGSAITVRHIAQWTGSGWLPIGDGFHDGSGFPVVVRDLHLHDNRLYAAGEFFSSGSFALRNIAVFDAQANRWQPVGSGLNSRVLTLGSWNGELIAGGTFSGAGGTSNTDLPRLARWSGSAWSALGGGVNDDPAALQGYRGELVVAGRFTQAGTTAARHWARWTADGLPPIISAPQDRTVTQGQIAYLIAATSAGYANPWPVIAQWSRNGVPIANGPEGAAPGGGVVVDGVASPAAWQNLAISTLRIQNAQPADAGEYTVSFTSACGSTTSGTAVLTVLPATAQACSIADIVGIGGTPPGDGLLTGDDFVAFVNNFGFASPGADIVGIGGLPPADGLITGDDFNAFIAAFAAGCP